MAVHKSICKYMRLNKSKDVIKGLRLSSPSPTSQSVTSNDHFIATGNGAKGDVILLPRDLQWKYNINPYVIKAHGEILSDIQFNPYVSNILATSSRESAFKIFKVPSDGKPLETNDTKEECVLGEFEYGVRSLGWHCSAKNILGVAGQDTFGLYDIDTQTAFNEIEFKEDKKKCSIFGWNNNGSQIAVGDVRSGYFGLFDPRTDEDITWIRGKGKTHKLIYLKDGNIMKVGVDVYKKPNIQIFDIKTHKEICKERLNMATGLVLSEYDIDQELLYVTVRGSNMMNVYDVHGSRVDPITSNSMNSSYQGFVLTPKRLLDLHEMEVTRIYQRSKDKIVPLHGKVPRKVRAYHKELYPDTRKTTTSLSAEDYLNGENQDPELEGLDAYAAATKDLNKRNNLSNEPQKKTFSGGAAKKFFKPKSFQVAKKKQKSFFHVAESSKTVEEKAKSQMDSKGNYVKSGQRSKLEQKFKKSPYMNIKGSEPLSKNLRHYDIKLGPYVTGPGNLVTNQKWLGFPWKSIGGSALCLLKKDKPGRVGGKSPKVRGHKDNLTVFDISKVQQNLLATGSLDGIVKVFEIPDELKQDLTEPKYELQCSGKVTYLGFHPYFKDTLVTASAGYGAFDLRVWNLATQEEAMYLDSDTFNGEITNVSWNFAGDLMAVCCKDGFVRIINPVTKNVEFKCEPKENVRDLNVHFCTRDSDKFITSGFAKGSQQRFGLWSISEGKEIEHCNLFRNNSKMLTKFDWTMDLFYVAQIGAPTFKIYDFNPKPEGPDYFEEISAFGSMSDVVGVSYDSPHELSIKSVHAAVAYKLTKDDVIKVTFTIPRKRKTFFQDDLYCTVRKLTDMNATKFFSGAKIQPEEHSLRPDGMELLSNAPKEELTARQKKYKNFLAEQNKEKEKGVLGHTSKKEVQNYFRKLATSTNVRSNKFDAKRDDSGKPPSDDDDDWDC